MPDLIVRSPSPAQGTSAVSQLWLALDWGCRDEVCLHITILIFPVFLLEWGISLWSG